LLNDAYDKAANGQKREERERKNQDAKTRPPLLGSSAAASRATCSVRESEKERKKLESFSNPEPVTKEARQAKEARHDPLVMRSLCTGELVVLDGARAKEGATPAQAQKAGGWGGGRAATTRLKMTQLISSFMQQLDPSIPLESVTLRDLKQAVMPHFDNWVLFFFCKGLGFS
jgi:hypothetical protein